ncbi:MAG: AraC family transcriptional regulator [Moraxellaceae bacterium]|nr:AraC family transcriptional regulator [Moraxellaceae bacterium]
MTGDMHFQATYSRMIARELQLDTSGLGELLAGTSLTPGHLFQLDQQISAQDQYTIIHNGLRLSGNPAFGLQLGSRLHVSAHGTLGIAISTAANLRESFQAVARFHNLRAQFIRLDYRDEGSRYEVNLRLQVPMDAVGLFLMEAMVASTQWNIEFVLGRRVAETIIELGYPPPDHAARYAEYLHGQFSFGHDSTRISLPAALLDTPNPFRDDEAFAQAMLQCERMAAALRPKERWSERVSTVLQQHPGQLWTLTEVAAVFNISARSLIRHLQSEGSCYQAVLDAELHRQALLHFESPRHTVASVAATLGYQDVSAFRRAFKRWAGQTPQAWLASRRR